MNKLLAVFTGAVIALMIVVNGVLSDAMGAYSASVFIHFTGILAVILILIKTKSTKFQLKGIHPLIFTGGLLGVFTTVANLKTIFVLGVSLTMAAGLLGEMLLSFLFDYFGFFGLEKIKVTKEKTAGLILIASGVALMAVL